jgi:hypothetical protein
VDVGELKDRRSTCRSIRLSRHPGSVT